MALRVFGRFLLLGGAAASVSYFVYRRFWKKKPEEDILSFYGVTDDDTDCEKDKVHSNDDHVESEENVKGVLDDIMSEVEYHDHLEKNVKEVIDHMLDKVEYDNHVEKEEVGTEVLDNIMSEVEYHDHLEKNLNEVIDHMLDEVEYVPGVISVQSIGAVVQGNVRDDHLDTEEIAKKVLDSIQGEIENMDPVEKTVREVMDDIMDKVEYVPAVKSVQSVGAMTLGTISDFSTESRSHFDGQFDYEKWRWMETEDVLREIGVRRKKKWRQFKGLRKFFNSLSCKRKAGGEE